MVIDFAAVGDGGTFHSNTAWSAPADATVLPSGAKATAWTSPSPNLRSSEARGRPVTLSRTATRPADETARRRPSGENWAAAQSERAPRLSHSGSPAPDAERPYPLAAPPWVT